MSLQSLYEGFLASPKADALAQDAVLSYVTTLTSFSDSAAIIKHLDSQRRAVRKRKESTLNAIADRHSLFLEVETVLEFVTGGGTYLPGLDDNFLTDQVVLLPIQHVVHFDTNGKIKQIRLYWDQGALLKSVDVIGSRAKSWPIRDGKDQIRLITSSVNAGAIEAADDTNDRRQSSSRPSKNPHRTLEPFAANIPEESDDRSEFSGPAVQPRASARPARRGVDELFVNEHEHRERSMSPIKHEGLATKSGAGQNYKENRLFGDAKSAADEYEDKFKSPHPNKFNHFSLQDGHEEDHQKGSGPKARTKHQSQWDFSDFSTPVKPASRKQNQRSLDFEDQTAEETLARRPHSRKESHFEFNDEEQERGPRPHSRGNQFTSIKDKTLFSNNVISEEGALDTNGRGQSRGVLANVKDRQKDFGNHWDMSDNPTHGDRRSDAVGANLKDRHKDFDPHFRIKDSPDTDEQDQKKPLSTNQGKAVRMMQPSWSLSENTPERKENRLMNIAGNGMGSRAGVGRGWSIGED